MANKRHRSEEIVSMLRRSLRLGSQVMVDGICYWSQVQLEHEVKQRPIGTTCNSTNHLAGHGS